MIAFSWRQFRSQAVWVLGAVVLVGIVLVATGPYLAHVYEEGAQACRSAGGSGPLCTNPVVHTFLSLQVALYAVVLVAPALLGMFWGAPLIGRELETGTFRLVLTQSVSRRRWLLIKIGLVGIASMFVGLALGLMATWWASPVDKALQDRLSPGMFPLHGIVPGAYALFAFALGATAGLVLRRTLPAMVVSLVGFVLARVLVTDYVRPNIIPPTTKTFALSPGTFGINVSPSGGARLVPQPPTIPNAWVTSTQAVDKAGRPITTAVLKQFCSAVPGVSGAPPPANVQGAGVGGVNSARSVGQPPPSVQNALNHCVTALSARYHIVAMYQPANRFWALQAMEFAVFLTMALALAAFCFWWLRHRLG